MRFIQLFGRIRSTISLGMQTGNELMLCQLEAQVLEPTRFFRTKQTPILLEFLAVLGGLCLKVGFCLSVIPFSSAINVISTRNAALV